MVMEKILAAGEAQAASAVRGWPVVASCAMAELEASHFMCPKCAAEYRVVSRRGWSVLSRPGNHMPHLR